MLFQICLLWALLCPQEPQPTLQETTDFLSAKLPELATYTGKANGTTIHARVTSASVNACQLTYQSREEYTKEIKAANAYQFAIPLALLDPARIEVKTAEAGGTPPMLLLFLSAKDGKKSIEKIAVEENQGRFPKRGKTLTGTAYLMLDSPENADRLVKAFRHAVKLCGEKKEPF